MVLIVLIGSGSAVSLSEGATGPASEQPPALVTALTADVSAGATVIEVDDESTFEPGDEGVVNFGGASEEVFSVDSLGSLHLQSGLESGHSVGDTVVNLTRLLAQTKGDVNCDGVLNIADVLSGLKTVGGLPEIPCFDWGGAFGFGDLDCDGDVDGADYLLLLLHLADLATPLPEGCPGLPDDPVAGPTWAADLEVVTAGVQPVSVQMPTNTFTDVAIETIVQNLGPNAVTWAREYFTLTAPANCTIFELPVLFPFVYPAPGLQGPIPQTANPLFRVNCTEPGLYVFDVCLEIQPKWPWGITDVNPLNNDGCYQISALVGNVDLEVFLPGVADLPDPLPLVQFEFGDVTLAVGNAAPGPVDAAISLEMAIGGAPTFFYRWVPEPGDLCFFNDGQDLIPVPCGEDHADPTQPTTIFDDCFDGLDNDGDGLVDFAGGDPDCLVGISDLHWVETLPGLDITDVSRFVSLRCTGPGAFTLTVTGSVAPVPPVIDTNPANDVGSTVFNRNCGA